MAIIDDVKNRALNVYKTYQEPINTVKEALTTTKDTVAHLKDAYQDIKGVAKQVTDKVAKTGVLSRLKSLGVAGKLHGVVTNLTNLPNEALTLAKDVRQFVKSGSLEDANKALDGARGMVETTAETTEDTAKAGKLFKAIAPKVSKPLMKLAGESATRTTVKVAETASKMVGKAVLKSGVGTVAKAAGRFVPGANVALAAIDVGRATSALADPNASLGKKIGSCITAAGSIVAATNIPIVSQAGAAVSCVSDFVTGFFK